MTTVQTDKPPAVPQLHTIRWQGIEIELRYCRSWLESFERVYGHPMAHLEIETIQPDREPLPITETGYKSHFTPAHDIEAAGGPEAYVQAWLDWAGQSPEWQERRAAGRQLSLFG